MAVIPSSALRVCFIVINDPCFLHFGHRNPPHWCGSMWLITSCMYAHGRLLFESWSDFSISGPTSAMARARTSVLMADMVINMTDVHGAATLTSVHFAVSGKLSALLDIIICVMISTLLYMIAAAFRSCRDACFDPAPKHAENDGVQLIERNEKQSSH